jgi:hypothetical protein
MNKEHILSEIRRTSAQNGGIPLGRRRFEKETGIRGSDWLGTYWARWGDALKEAGFGANEFQAAYSKEFLIEAFIGLIRELGRVPVEAELRMKAHKEKSFPGHSALGRLGSKSQRLQVIVAYCQSRQEYQDVIQIIGSVPIEHNDKKPIRSEPITAFGSVYLLKSGRYYKLGRSNAFGRREAEIALQLPQKADTVHVIKTDDPIGIEAYWHKRFETKRKNGEWFELDQNDITAFKRRKFM